MGQQIPENAEKALIEGNGAQEHKHDVGENDNGLGAEAATGINPDQDMAGGVQGSKS